MPKSKVTRSGSRADGVVEFCRTLPGAEEDVKWGKDLIFSVGGKMFAGFQMPEGQPIGFMVDPDDFDPLVKRDGIIPAPYMAKHSWVSVTDRRKVKVTELKAWLRESHRLTARKLSKKAQRALGVDQG